MKRIKTLAITMATIAFFCQCANNNGARKETSNEISETTTEKSQCVNNDATSKDTINDASEETTEKNQCINNDTTEKEISEDTPETTAEKVYTLSSEAPYFLVNEQFVTKTELRGYSNITPYTLVSELTFDTDYSLKLYEYKDWESEAGDFRVIQLQYRGEEILSHIDEDAWEEIPSKFLTYSSTPTNGDVLLFALENDVKLLAFIGVTYASQPPMFTVIAVKNNAAKVVFDMPFVVDSINKTSDNIEFVLGDAYEGTSGELAPQYYRLYSTDEGILCFKKAEE